MTSRTEQWEAVTMVLLLMRVPPQMWRPLTWREAMKGNSPAEAAVPPTMESSGVSSQVKSGSWGVGAARTSAGSAAARMDSKRMVFDECG